MMRGWRRRDEGKKMRKKRKEGKRRESLRLKYVRMERKGRFKNGRETLRKQVKARKRNEGKEGMDTKLGE